jgi:NADPH:quinone reductase
LRLVPKNVYKFGTLKRRQIARLERGLDILGTAIDDLDASSPVLVQGASSGVGLMALKIAKLMGAGLVIGTSTNEARRARLKESGADLALDSRSTDWVEAAQKATAGKGVDLIIDQISGYVANANMQAASVLGRIVNVSRLGGMKGEFDFDLHAMKRIDYIGVTFRTRSTEEIREINRRMRADLLPAVESGELRLPIDKAYPFAEADAAFAHMRAHARQRTFR